jgi:hypothetical protein
MLDHSREWIAALAVLVLTAVAVILDITDRAVRQFWYQHSFTSSVVAGLLVLLLTVLVVDRVNRMRQVKGQGRVIGVQAAVIVAQTGRAAEAVRRSAESEEAREEASEELRTLVQMLLTSSPVLIDARASREFLEGAQRTAGRLFRAVRVIGEGQGADVGPDIDAALAHLRQVAAPLVGRLNREQRAAVGSDAAGEEAGRPDS